MQAVILVGDLATRLGDITNNKPKTLVEIQGKLFLQYQLEFLKENGINDIVLCIGYLGHRIQDISGNGSKDGVNIQCSIEDKLLGTEGDQESGATTGRDIFTLYGDSYFRLNFNDIRSNK
jgi:NDP-sugar pyrophosphorylase family protein